MKSQLKNDKRKEKITKPKKRMSFRLPVVLLSIVVASSFAFGQVSTKASAGKQQSDVDKKNSGFEVRNLTTLKELDYFYSLNYNINGGILNSEPAEKRLAVPQKVALDYTEIPKHRELEGKKVVFIGWTENMDSRIYAKDDDKPETISSVFLSEPETMVYALWGFDVDNDGVADVLQQKYRLNYDVNGGVVGSGPQFEEGLLNKNERILLKTPRPQYPTLNGERIVFIGWSSEKDTKIYSKDDMAPQRITTVNIKDSDVAVYALWGYDSDENNIADVLQDKFAIILDVNFGVIGSGPARVTNLLPQLRYELPLAPIPVRQEEQGVKVAFIGWSDTRHSTIYEANDVMPVTLRTIDIVNSDEIVYAVWGYDSDGDGVADILQDKYTLIYNVNGGIIDNGTLKESNILANSSYELNQTLKPLHRSIENKEVVFVGWSKKAGSRIYDKDDIAPELLTTIAIDQDMAVYAVWGFDVDGDGTADVTQTKYQVSYEINGGISGSGPQQELALLPEEQHLLLKTPWPQHEDHEGKRVTFIGWSKEENRKIYTKDDQIPNKVKSVSIRDTDITVYALWGYDSDGSGTADVLQDKYNLYYDVGSGIANSGPQKELNLIATDDHRLLFSPLPKHSKIDNTAVVFLGYSLEADPHIYDIQDKLPELLETADIINEDVTVYVLWAYDRDNNGVADIVQEKFSVIYNANGGLLESRPPKENNLLAQNDYLLNNVTIPLHNDIEEKKVVFIGWGLKADNTIYTKDDSKPKIVINVTIDDSDLNVYALWGFDSDENGVADVLESKYRVVYNVNGGIFESGPVEEVNLLAEGNHTLLKNPKPLHNDVAEVAVVFVGWSVERDTKIYDKQDDVPQLIREIDIVDKNEIVYAVWGFDSDNNGIADVLQDNFSVIYDVNGGVIGSGPNKDTDLLAQSDYELNSKYLPYYLTFEDKAVVFIGWSTQRQLVLFNKDNKLPALVNKVDIIDQDVKVYAVWGLDSDNNGIADVLQEKFSLNYNINGGILASGPETETNLIAGTSYSLNLTPKPRHKDLENKRVVFIGWSKEVDYQIYSKDDQVPETIDKIIIENQDTAVYAVWGFDADGEGTADVLQEKYSLYYDVNGGISGSGPQMESALLWANHHRLIKNPYPQHSDVDGVAVVFFGWSLQQDTKIYAKGDTIPPQVKTVSISDRDIVVYALWGYDTDGNRIADVIQDENSIVHELYDLHNDDNISGEHQALTRATNTNASGAPVYLQSEKPMDKLANTVAVGWYQAIDRASRLLGLNFVLHLPLKSEKVW